MNTIRTISVQCVSGDGVVPFYIDIPFEVDMVKLVDTRSYGSGVLAMAPRISFLPKNQVVCIANKNYFPSALPVEYYYQRPTPIIGTHYITNDAIGNETKPLSYLMFVFEFWSFKAGLPMEIRPTNWQNEMISVSSRDNSFPLDILFPVDEIIIENTAVINFNVTTLSSLVFYSDFVPSIPEYVLNKDPIVGTDLVSNGLSKSRVSGGIVALVSNSYDSNGKYRYRFQSPVTIRGVYRIWNSADPQTYPSDLLSPISSYLWDNGTDVVNLFVKFISYR
jgi:hypothetical protein